MNEAALLWVARESGVLEAMLTSADDAAEAAEAAGVSGRSARILVRELARVGVLEPVEGGYEPTNRALGFLTRTDPRSIGSLPHEADLLGRIAALPDGLGDARNSEGGDAESDGPPTPAPEHWTANRLGAVAATDEATVRATVTAAVRALPGAESVVDVGTAPGTFATEFARRGYDPTLVARPDAAARSRPLLANEPVDVVERSIPPESLPGADLAFVPDLTHRLSPTENRDLCSTLADAVAPGGSVVLVDHLRDRSAETTRVALEALASTPAGDVYPAESYREWLRGAELDPEVRPIPGVDRWAVVGRA